MAGLNEQTAELSKRETQPYLAEAIAKIIRLRNGEAALVTGTAYESGAEERLRRRVEELREAGLKEGFSLDENGRDYGFYMRHLQNVANILGLVVFRGPFYDIENVNIEELRKLRGFVVRKKTGNTNHIYSIADVLEDEVIEREFDSTRVVAIDSNSYFHFMGRQG